MVPRLVVVVVSFCLLIACTPQTEAPGRPSQASETAPPTPEALKARIADEGAEAVVLSLSTPPRTDGLDAVWDGIATGEDRWLSLAPLLRPGVDGLTGEAWADALARALPRNPTGVLRVLKVSGGAGALTCPATRDARTLAAVQAVDDAALAEVKRDCLAYLQAP